MAEEPKVEAEPVKDVEPEPVKDTETITNEPLQETNKKTNKIPATKKEPNEEKKAKKNIKVIPLASELDHGLKPDESGGRTLMFDVTPQDANKEVKEEEPIQEKKLRC